METTEFITISYEGSANGTSTNSTTLIDVLEASLVDVLRAVERVLWLAGHPINRLIAEYDSEKLGRTIRHSTDD